MKRLSASVKKFEIEFRTKFALAIVGAFAFVIALSWNEFMKEAVLRIVTVLGLNGQTLLLKLFAAVLITVLCVIGIRYFSKWGGETAK